MKNFIFILFLFSPLVLFSQNKSGLLINGGNTFFRDIHFAETDWIKREFLESQYAASAGFRFRIQPEKMNHFYDFDLLLGLKKYKSRNNEYTYISNGEVIIQQASYLQYTDFSFSFGGSYNYKIFNNFSAGIGISPTVYLIAQGKPECKFDIPVDIRTAYNFRFVEAGLYYNMGFLNSMYSKDFSSGKRSEWGISLFISF